MKLDQYASISGRLVPAHGEEDAASAPMVTVDQIVGILRRQIVLIAACVVLTIGAAAVILSQMTPQFSASAQVKLVQPERVNRTVGNLLSEIDVDDKFIAGEVQVMESGRLLAKVVESLELYESPEFNPELREEDSLFATVRRLKGTVMGLFRPAAPPPAGAAEENPVFTKALNAQRDAIGEYGTVIGALRSQMRVRQVGNTSVVDINVVSADPRKATAIANTVADSYIMTQIESRFASVRRVTNWLNDRLSDLRTELERSETAVQDFIARELLANGETTRQLEKEIDELTSRLAAAQSDRANAVAEVNMLRDLIDRRGIDAAAVVLASSIVEGNRDRMVLLRQRESEIAERFGPDTDKLTPVRLELDALAIENRREVNRLMDERLALADVAAERMRILEERMGVLRARSIELGRSEVELRQLRREADANKAVYEKFLATYKESRELGDLRQSLAEVISYAEVPSAPSSPRSKVALVLAAFAGISAGVGLALLREFFRRGVVDAEQLTRKTGVEAFGSFSRLRNRREDVLDTVVADPRSPLAEEARSLRSLLLLGNAQRPLVIAATSSRHGEGGTTTAMLLARAFGEMGTTCLVIDADLMRRTLSQRLEIAVGPDLIDCLTGKAEMVDAMRVDERLHCAVLPIVGEVVDPSALLMSCAMDRVLAMARENFEVVVIDTPPILATTAEPLVMGRHADVVLLTAEWNATPRKTIIEAIGAMRRVNAKQLGLVFSKVDRRAEARFNRYVNRYGGSARPSPAFHPQTVVG